MGDFRWNMLAHDILETIFTLFRRTTDTYISLVEIPVILTQLPHGRYQSTSDIVTSFVTRRGSRTPLNHFQILLSYINSINTTEALTIRSHGIIQSHIPQLDLLTPSSVHWNLLCIRLYNTIVIINTQVYAIGSVHPIAMSITSSITSSGVLSRIMFISPFLVASINLTRPHYLPWTQPAIINRPIPPAPIFFGTVRSTNGPKFYVNPYTLPKYYVIYRVRNPASVRIPPHLIHIHSENTLRAIWRNPSVSRFHPYMRPFSRGQVTRIHPTPYSIYINWRRGAFRQPSALAQQNPNLMFLLDQNNRSNRLRYNSGSDLEPSS